MQHKRMILALSLALLSGMGTVAVILGDLRIDVATTWETPSIKDLTPLELASPQDIAVEKSQTSQVVVASRELRAGTVVQPLDIEVVQLSGEEVPATYASDKSLVLGRELLTHISANEPILETNLARSGQGSGLPDAISEGTGADSVQVDEGIDIPESAVLLGESSCSCRRK